MREARRLVDAETAEDAAQEAALRAWRARAMCRERDPAAWVRTIARREALRIAVRRREEPVPEPLSQDEQPSATHEERPSWLHDHLRQLSEPERSVLFLRYWADKSDSEIAAALGLPLGTVKIRIFRARQKLAAGVGDRPPAD